MLLSMRPNQDSSIQYLKSTPSDPTNEAAAEDVVVEEGVAIIEVVNQILQHLHHLPVQPDIEVPGIQIFLQESGQDVPCTSNMGKELFSAQNRLHVLGKTSMLQDQANEISTSLVNQKIQRLLQFKTLCTITKSIQKYTAFVKMKSKKI